MRTFFCLFGCLFGQLFGWGPMLGCGSCWCARRRGKKIPLRSFVPSLFGALSQSTKGLLRCLLTERTLGLVFGSRSVVLSADNALRLVGVGEVRDHLLQTVGRVGWWRGGWECARGARTREGRGRGGGRQQREMLLAIKL